MNEKPQPVFERQAQRRITVFLDTWHKHLSRRTIERCRLRGHLAAYRHRRAVIWWKIQL
jgi:hypothetical protein